MPVQLTIIGLGRIGGSIGLALKDHGGQITRVGHDREPGIARRAPGLGVVDRIHFSLPAAVEGADFVVLALPLDQIRETLEIIGPCLQENAVVMDTCPVKGSVVRWAKEYLPANRHYVGLIPAINPAYLMDSKNGIEAARADMFSKGLVAVLAPAGTAGAAIKLAVDLASLLGASPFFYDLAEADSMMAGLHVLPQLSAAALTHATVGRPGWLDARKLIGGVYATATAPVTFDAEEKALVETAFQDRDNVTRLLTDLITSLQALREYLVEEKRDDLEAWLEAAYLGRARWWRERSTGDWQSEELAQSSYPRISLWKRLFGDMGKFFGPPRSSDEEKEG